jgi:hypothetical protein
MAGKKSKVENLVSQLIESELETQLARLVKRSKRKAMRARNDLNGTLRLEYTPSQGFSEAEEAEVIESQSEEGEDLGESG